MNTKLKCLLLDDELPGLTYLRMLCEEVPGVEVVRAFDDPETFLKASGNLEYDFCILDIEMPKMNGLQVAELVKGKPVIFTTAYKEFAAEAFDLNAVDYIRKPIQKDRFEKAIVKVAALLRTPPVPKQYAQFNTDKGKAILYFNQVSYITSSDIDKRDKIVLTSDGRRITLKNINFENLLSLLPPGTFCRINKKDIISLKVVRFFSNEEITTSIPDKNTGMLKLPLSETYRTEFKSRLNV